MAETISLETWLHPAMNELQGLKLSGPVSCPATATVNQLMELIEETVEEQSKEAGKPVQLNIQVLWNVKDKKKALNPTAKVADNFASGDTVAVYGDAMLPVVEKVKVPEEDKLPVTILTGFLGSGKTTLLNYILREQKEKKIAVIENEFGEVSIDDALLKQDKLAMAEEVIVMDNGCMCCTVRGDLQKGLMQILDKKNKEGKQIDAIMIETTGMADPVPVVRTFMTSEDITSELRLDGVITLCDAKNILGRLDDNIEEGKVNEAYQQVAFCDKLILNKLDLVTAEQAIVVKDRLRSINSFAKILPAVKSNIKMSELWNIRAHDMANFVNTDIEKEAPPAEEEHGSGHGGDGGGHGEDKEELGHGESSGHGGGHGSGGHGGGHGASTGGHGDGGHGTTHESGHGSDEPPSKKSRHDSRVNSFSVVKEGEIIPMKLSKWMQSIGSLPEEKGVIFRIKAILAVKGHPFKHVFHAVMDVSDEDDAGPWEPGERKICKIVFIGKSMDQKFLRDGFEEIFERVEILE
jgi:G3E family GTPase